MLIQSFEGFIRETGHKGSYEIDRGFLNLQLNGQSAHGSTPEEGVNAGLELLKFLTLLELDPSGRKFVNFAADYIIDNFKGDQFKMNYSHEEMGEVSVNTGIINYTEVDGGEFGVNLRYPIFDFDRIEQYKEAIQDEGFTVEGYKSRRSL